MLLIGINIQLFHGCFLNDVYTTIFFYIMIMTVLIEIKMGCCLKVFVRRDRKEDGKCLGKRRLHSIRVIVWNNLRATNKIPYFYLDYLNMLLI